MHPLAIKVAENIPWKSLFKALAYTSVLYWMQTYTRVGSVT